jgi:hypothetical protein
MADLGKITLTGKSGKNYEFQIVKRSATFTAVGAIYVMSKVVKTNSYSLIYIGETGDLSKRPLNHHRTDCFDEHGADMLLIRAAPDSKQRLADETDLIQAYDPVCNLQ